LAQESAEELVELGNARAASGDHAAAVNCYARALALDPALAVAHNNYSLSLTALGRLREAWAEAEWRFQLQPAVRDFLKSPPLPFWRGERIEDELLVLWEQASGDMIQYLRFLPLARERVGAVGIICPPELRRLVASSFPAVELLPPDQAVTWSDYVAFVPLLSLPHVMGLDEQSLPTGPYLKVPEQPKSSKVGIVWRSSAFDPSRNCRLEDLQPLADAGLDLVSLQYEPTADERDRLRAWGAEERGSSFKDFFDTAVALQTVRALVTVDTSVAHLAGALGVPAHLLLNEPAAVRWMSGEKSLWYPSMRLHRKVGVDAWQGSMARVLSLLRG
jgi:tetratricopeptide (TPR) repeat protein